MFSFVSLNYSTLSAPGNETENAQPDVCGSVSLEAFTDDARLCLAPLEPSLRVIMKICTCHKTLDLLFSWHHISKYLSFLLCFKENSFVPKSTHSGF